MEESPTMLQVLRKCKNSLIATLSESELYDVLKVQMIKIGYTKVLNDDAAEILVYLVKKHYGRLTVDLVDRAFDNAITGFDTNAKDLDCYEFNFAYFAKIVKSETIKRINRGDLKSNIDQERQYRGDSSVDTTPVDWKKFVWKMHDELKAKGKRLTPVLFPVNAYDQFFIEQPEKFKEFLDSAATMVVESQNRKKEVSSISDCLSMVGDNVEIVAKKLAVIDLVYQSE